MDETRVVARTRRPGATPPYRNFTCYAVRPDWRAPMAPKPCTGTCAKPL